ncbi:zincin-like metallopeptidase toxin domain-containing protein [uncultured Chryseobacterium sp.]|uniref:zincin-like metallopeptidase toxin domain-containing protein n=1 Tax=uncultured Chryseobacterium sp. TaxID=259322 RepID=UPI0025D0ECD1|nr:zincin-like metallopeptidase toxin domain-containing protein [uncultured Chryseobacterium sp.]
MTQRLEYVLSRNIDSPLGENSVFYETFVVPPELKDIYPKSEKYSVVHHQAVFCKSGIEVFDRYEKDKIEPDYFTIYYEEISKDTSNFFGTACRVKMGDYAKQRLIKDYNSKGKTINYDGNTVDGSVSNFNGLIKLIAKDYGIDDTLLKGAIYLEILEKSKINEAFKKVSSLNNQLADWLRGGIEATEKWKFTEENYDYIKFYVEPMYNNYQNKIGASGFPKQEVKYKPIIPVPFPCNEYKNMSDNQQGIVETGLKKLSEFVASFDEISTAAVFNIVAATPTIADDILFAVTFLVKNFIEDNMPDNIKNIYNQLKVLFKEVQNIVSDIGSLIIEKSNQEIAKINAFLCGILNGLISLVQLIIMLLAMIVDNIPIFELEKTSALELAKHQEKFEFIEDFVDLFDKNAKEFLNGIKKLFTDENIWKDISTFISGWAKKISNYNEYFWAYFIGGVAFELILDAVIAYFTGGSSLVAQASAKISRLTAKAEQAGAKALNFSKNLGKKIVNTAQDLYKWLEKEFLEMIEAIKNGKVAEWIKKKIDAIFGSGNRIQDEVVEDIEELFRKINDGFGFDGGRLLTIKELKKLRKLLKELYDVDLKIVDKDFGMKQKLKDWNSRGVVGSFNPRLKTMFLRSEVSELTVFHEMVHMKTWKRLSSEEYAKLPLWEDETMVWDAIWKTKEKWTKRELVDSYEYLNDKIRIPMGQPKLVIEEMDELVKLRKLGILK